MRMLSLLTKIAVFLLLLGFAVKNTDAVTIRYFLGLEWQAPLAFVLLVVFGLGLLGGLLTGLMVMARQRRELLRLKRELHAQRRGPAPVPTYDRAQLPNLGHDQGDALSAWMPSLTMAECFRNRRNAAHRPRHRAMSAPATGSANRKLFL